ncbi:UNVERIFIED_CONTAM: hypothetical protein RMT77_012410 [Armadillidium vulgare]
MNVFVVVSDIIKEQVTLHNRTKHTMLAIMDKSCAEESAKYPDIPLHIFLNNVKDNFTQPFEVGDVLRIHNLMGDFYPKEQKMYAKIFWSKSVVKFKLTEENNKVTPITTNTAYRLTEQDTNLVRELRLFWRKLVQQKERERLKNERLSTKKISEVTSPCTFSANCLVKNIQFKNTESFAVLTVTDSISTNMEEDTSKRINTTTGKRNKERDVMIFEPLSKKVSTLKVGQSIRLVNIICTSRSKGLALVYSNLDFYMTSEKGEIKQIENQVFNAVSVSSDEEAPSSTQTGAGEEPSCSKQPERLVQNSGATSSRILTSDKESQSTETPPSGQLEEELDCEIIEPERVVINLDDSDVSEAQTNDSDVSEAQTNDSDVSEAQTNDSDVSEAQTNDSDVSEAQTNDSDVSEAQTNDSHLSEAQNNDSALSETQNNERSDNYSEETNEATMMEDDEGSDSRIFVKGLDTRTDIYVFKSPESSMILGNDCELENQTLRDNSDTDNTQDSEVLGNPSKKRKFNHHISGLTVPPKQISANNWENLEVEFYSGEVNKENDGEGSGGGTQEYKDGGLDSEESESVVVAKSVTKKRKVPPDSSLELANDEGEVNKENDGEGSGGGTQEYKDGGLDLEESESVVVAKSVTKKRKVPPESSLELANNEGEVNKENDGEGSGGGTQEYKDGGLDLEESESVVVAKSVTKKRKVPPDSSLELANNDDEMEEVSVAADEDSCVERTGDNKTEGRVERTGDNDNTENPVEPPVSPMVLENNNGLENQAPSDDDNSSQQSEPRNITSESDSDGKKRIRKRRKKRSYDFINMNYISVYNENEEKIENKKRYLSEFWNNSKPGEMGSVWCRLISIDFVSREPCSKCIDVNCYHDWTWGMCRECGAEFSSAQLRNSFSTSDLIKYKALPCFECTTPSDAATIKPQFRLTVCLKDLVTDADFNVELSGDFAEEFLGTQPTFKWTVEEAPENFDDKITQFYRECLRRPLVLVVNKICSIDGTTLRFCQAKLTT